MKKKVGLLIKTTRPCHTCDYVWKPDGKCKICSIKFLPSGICKCFFEWRKGNTVTETSRGSDGYVHYTAHFNEVSPNKYCRIDQTWFDNDWVKVTRVYITGSTKMFQGKKVYTVRDSELFF